VGSTHLSRDLSDLAPATWFVVGSFKGTRVVCKHLDPSSPPGPPAPMSYATLLPTYSGGCQSVSRPRLALLPPAIPITSAFMPMASWMRLIFSFANLNRVQGAGFCFFTFPNPLSLPFPTLFFLTFFYQSPMSPNIDPFSPASSCAATWLPVSPPIASVSSPPDPWFRI
jgi:hypothetical protein